jgi:phosphonate transport system substrate-binding protein
MKYIVLLLSLMVATAQAAAAPTQDNAKTTPLRFGLLPYMSTQSLLLRYAPLQHYLETTLQRRVKPVTAPNFATYIARARRHEYDIYLTAPHFAALAENQSGYQRISRMLRQLDGTIVVRKNGPIHALTDLREHTFATPDALAIVTFLGEQRLAQRQLTPGRDVTIETMPSHNAAILAVAGGQADAAVTSEAVLESMPTDVQARITVLEHTDAVPHMMVMASPTLDAAEIAALRAAFLDFTAAGPGKQFFEQTGYGDMVPITDADMQSMQPFVKMLEGKALP